MNKQFSLSTVALLTTAITALEEISWLDNQGPLTGTLASRSTQNYNFEVKDTNDLTGLAQMNMLVQTGWLTIPNTITNVYHLAFELSWSEGG